MIRRMMLTGLLWSLPACLVSCGPNIEKVRQENQAALLGGLESVDPALVKAAVRGLHWMEDAESPAIETSVLEKVAVVSGSSEPIVSVMAMELIQRNQPANSGYDMGWLAAGLHHTVWAPPVHEAAVELMATDCEGSEALFWDSFGSRIRGINSVGWLDIGEHRYATTHYFLYLEACGASDARTETYVALLDQLVERADSDVSSARWGGFEAASKAEQKLNLAATMMLQGASLDEDLTLPALVGLRNHRYLGDAARDAMTLIALRAPDKVRQAVGERRYQRDHAPATASAEDAAPTARELTRLETVQVANLVSASGDEAVLVEAGRRLCDADLELAQRSRLFSALVTHALFTEHGASSVSLPCSFQDSPRTDAAHETWLTAEKKAFEQAFSGGTTQVDRLPPAWALPVELVRAGKLQDAIACTFLIQAAAEPWKLEVMDEAAKYDSDSRKGEKLWDLAGDLQDLDLRDELAILWAIHRFEGSASEHLHKDEETGRVQGVDVRALAMESAADTLETTAADHAYTDAALSRARKMDGQKDAWLLSYIGFLGSAGVVDLVEDVCSEGFHAANVNAMLVNPHFTDEGILDLALTGEKECRVQALYALAERGDLEMLEVLLDAQEMEQDPEVALALNKVIYQLSLSAD